MPRLYGSVFITAWVCSTFGFNVDVKNIKVFKGPEGSYFGYSSAMMEDAEGKWLIVGAPRSSDKFQPDIQSPGALYKCSSIEKTCTQIMLDNTGNTEVSGDFYGVKKKFHHDKEDMWLGASVDVSPHNNDILTCAPRWRDAKLRSRDLLHMQGMCYVIPGTSGNISRLVPALIDKWNLVHQTELHPIWAYASLGHSAQFSKTKDCILMGAPGINDWQGGFVLEENNKNYTTQPIYEKRREGFLGYSITSANLLRSDKLFVVAGAPRAFLTGAVFIFEDKSPDYIKLQGDQLGSYFGASVCTADLNNDLLEDILVGAPLYADNFTDEGRVYVYINRGLHHLEAKVSILRGSRIPGARFGTAIGNIGDINKDSYTDIAVGTPYENDLTGAVYIYNGYRGGIWTTPTQNIRAIDLDTGLRAFGQSFSLRTIEDFSVGAFMSDNMVLFKPTKVVSLVTNIFTNYSTINRDDRHLLVTFCFKLTCKEDLKTKRLGMRYMLLVDKTYSANVERAMVVPGWRSNISRELMLTKDKFICDNATIFIQYKDIWKPVELDLSYEINQTNCHSCPILEQFHGDRPIESGQHWHRKMIEFEKNCGSDGLCEPELKLKVWPMNDNRGYLVSGEKKELYILIGIRNTGENAYNIVLNLTVPGIKKNLKAKDGDGVAVDCFNPDQSKNSTNETFHCEVLAPYPLETNTDITFKIIIPVDEFNTTGDIFHTEFALGTADSTDVLADDEIILPVRLVSDIAIKGVSTPEQIMFSRGMKKNISIRHLYAVSNLGPSQLQNRTVQVLVPVLFVTEEDILENTKVLLQIEDRSVTECLYCGAEDKFVLPRNSGSPFQTEEERILGVRHLNVDCEDLQCRSFYCQVGSLRRFETAYIHVNISMKESSLSKIRVRELMTIQTKLETQGNTETTNNTFEVTTLLYPTTRSGNAGKVQIWTIVVSASSAILLFFLFVVIIWKAGFFERPIKEDMRRLTASTDTSMNSERSQDLPDGLGNPNVIYLSLLSENDNRTHPNGLEVEELDTDPPFHNSNEISEVEYIRRKVNRERMRERLSSLGNRLSNGNCVTTDRPLDVVQVMVHGGGYNGPYGFPSSSVTDSKPSSSSYEMSTFKGYTKTKGKKIYKKQSLRASVDLNVTCSKEGGQLRMSCSQENIENKLNLPKINSKTKNSNKKRVKPTLPPRVPCNVNDGGCERQSMSLEGRVSAPQAQQPSCSDESDVYLVPIHRRRNPNLLH